MANLLNSGWKVPCKDTLGGMRKVYLAAYAYYPRSEFGFNGSVLTSIPTTFVHEFELDGSNNSFNDRFDGESYIQSLNIQFKKKDLATTIQMEKLNYLELRALVLDRNGNYLVLGLENGLSCDSLDIETGGSKSDFNGYKLSLSGKEQYSAPIVLDPFDNGFIVDEGETDFYQFQNLEAFHFQDGTIYEFN
jgi:hypothetical protein